MADLGLFLARVRQKVVLLKPCPDSQVPRPMRTSSSVYAETYSLSSCWWGSQVLSISERARLSLLSTHQIVAIVERGRGSRSCAFVCVRKHVSR